MDNTKISTNKSDNPLIREMFEAGIHFGYSKSRRHASVKDFIFGYKNKVAILDLEKSSKALEKALEFVTNLGAEGKQILFVGNKHEAREIVKKAALALDMPYVTERWIGGTLTNTTEIKKRINRLQEIKADEESGTLQQRYNKKERNLINKEKTDLERNFGGIVDLKKVPEAMIIVDSKAEDIAVREGLIVKVPLVSLSNSDCDISVIDYPVVANDTSIRSIEYFITKIVEAYKAGQKNKASQNKTSETDKESSEVATG
ncbi:MAG: 30S ribosomal protein S2 [Candidatus Paceibacterota bacterium]